MELMLSSWILARMGIQVEHSHRFTIDSYLMLNTYQKQNLTASFETTVLYNFVYKVG